MTDEPGLDVPPSRRRLLAAVWWTWTLIVAIRALAAGVGSIDSAAPSFDPITLDLNTASVAELALLPGLGPGRARAIVLHRVRHGPFIRIDDLAAVVGIGPTTVESIRPYVVSATGLRRAVESSEAYRTTVRSATVRGDGPAGGGDR